MFYSVKPCVCNPDTDILSFPISMMHHSITFHKLGPFFIYFQMESRIFLTARVK